MSQRYNQVDLACPNKPKKEQYMYVAGGEEESDYSDEDPNEVYNETNLSANNPQHEAQLAAQKEAELRHKAQEVDHDTWDIAEFFFDEVIDLSNDYVQENGKGGIKLKNGGVIKLAVSDGTLQLGTLTRECDFKVLKEVELKEKVSSDGKKMKKKVPMAPVSSDIVKSLYLEGFQVDGYNEAVIIRLATIPKFKEEGFYAGSDKVTKKIMKHEWHNPNHRIQIFDRTINNGTFSFQTKYPGANPENLDRGIQKPVNGFCLVDLNSPVIGAINHAQKAPIEGGEYLTPTLMETNQVLVPKDLVKEFREIALKSMSYGISYGAVTTNRFTVEFEAPVPSHLRAKAEEYAKNGTGRQFLGFADPYKNNTMALGAAINENIKSRSALFKDENSLSLRLQGKLVMQYKHVAEQADTQ